MKLGILAGYGGKVLNIDIQRIKMAESMGYDSLWTAEAYGSDAVTPAAWILAGSVTSLKYFSVVKAWMMTPSATSPATSVMRGPTAARNTLGAPYCVSNGVNIGVINE